MNQSSLQMTLDRPLAEIPNASRLAARGAILVPADQENVDLAGSLWAVELRQISSEIQNARGMCTIEF